MSHSISTAVPEPSAPGRGHAFGATAGQWPEQKTMWPVRRFVDLSRYRTPAGASADGRSRNGRETAAFWLLTWEIA
jgi:hypothetical protein